MEKAWLAVSMPPPTTGNTYDNFAAAIAIGSSEVTVRFVSDRNNSGYRSKI